MAGPIGQISSLLQAAGQGGAVQNLAGQGSTPPLDNFFGLDSRFLRAPAGGTALFNNILFGSSNQQVPIDFLKLGFYTGVPPIFGGTGFTGLPARFDLFAGQTGPVGVDAILGLERSLNGGGGSNVATGGTALGGSNNSLLTLLQNLLGGGTGTNTAQAGDSKKTDSKNATDNKNSSNTKAADASKSLMSKSLSQITLGELLQALA